MANVNVAGASNDSVTVVGTRTEVRRYAFSFGLSLGKELFLTESAASTPICDTSRPVGHELVTVDGSYAGMIMRARPQGEDEWTATIRREAMI